MKKVRYIGSLLLILVLLIGCKKEETKEVILCNQVEAYIEKYNNNQLTRDTLFNELNNAYNTHCQEESNGTCTSIKMAYDSFNEKIELQDCSKYNSSLKELKDMCETGNELNKERINNKDKVIESNISYIKTKCELAREED